jgi:hypothetical protein
MKNKEDHHIFITGKEGKQKVTDHMKVFQCVKDTGKRLKKLKWTKTEICVCRLHDDVDIYSGLNQGT